jgi:hypothetical protein
MVDTDSVLDEIEERKPWHQQPGESDKDYGKFAEHYLPLPGVDASVRQAWISAKGTPDPPDLSAPSEWYDIANRHNWKERRRAYIRYQVDQRVEAEQQERLDARRLRREKFQAKIALLDDLIAEAREAGNSSEARLLLGELRLYLAELRREHGDEITKVEQVDPNQVIELEWPGVLDDES